VSNSIFLVIDFPSSSICLFHETMSLARLKNGRPN
jgi:hypothetical protein